MSRQPESPNEHSGGNRSGVTAEDPYAHNQQAGVTVIDASRLSAAGTVPVYRLLPAAPASYPHYSERYVNRYGFTAVPANGESMSPVGFASDGSQNRTVTIFIPVKVDRNRPIRFK